MSQFRFSATLRPLIDLASGVYVVTGAKSRSAQIFGSFLQSIANYDVVVGENIVLRLIGLDFPIVVSPLSQRSNLKLGLREDVVLVEDCILPVTVRIK